MYGTQKGTVENQMRTRSKFGVSMTEKGKAERTCMDYITGEPICFDSKLEKKYYEEIVVPGLKDGTFKSVDRQKRYVLQPSFKYQGKTIRAIEYVSDFTLTYPDGSMLVVDVKGRPTADAKIKKKMMHYVYPELNFIWVAHTKATGWLEYDALEKIRREKKKEKKK